MEVADLVILELLRLLSVSLGQATDAMPLQAAMQGRAVQVRDRVLECDVDIVEWQPRSHPQRHDSGFFHERKDAAAPLLRSHWQVFDRLSMVSLQDGLLIDPVSLREARDRSLRSLRMACVSWRTRVEPVPKKPPLRW